MQWLLLFLASCGVSGPVHIQVDPEFQSYVTRFVTEAYNRDRSIAATRLQIGWGDLPGNVVGRCYYQNTRIVLSKKYWDQASELRREQLMFHEMGHCLLRRGHEERMVDEIPVSVMYPKLFSLIFYNTYHDEYLKELFTRGRSIRFNASFDD